MNTIDVEYVSDDTENITREKMNKFCLMKKIDVFHTAILRNMYHTRPWDDKNIILKEKCTHVDGEYIDNFNTIMHLHCSNR